MCMGDQIILKDNNVYDVPYTYDSDICLFK